MAATTRAKMQVFAKSRPASHFWAWINGHINKASRGYVINTYQAGPHQKYVVLHDATCPSINPKRYVGTSSSSAGRS